MLLLDSTVVNIAQRKICRPRCHASEMECLTLYPGLRRSCFRSVAWAHLQEAVHRRMAIFTAASALCGVSSWLGDLVGISGVNALILARAFMMPPLYSLLCVFPPDKRGAAMGIQRHVALSAVIGPIVGGFIVTDYAWEWVFLINVPVGIIAILATIAIVPESVDPHASRRIDWGGVVLSGTGIFAIVYALIEADSMGWTDPLIVGLFILGVVLLAAFVWWEKRLEDPLMKLELFALRNFSVGNVIAFVVAFGMLGIFFPRAVPGASWASPIRAGMT